MNVPLFCTGFVVSNDLECKMIEYIKEQVDQLDLVSIGMRSLDEKFDWYGISNNTKLAHFISRYAVDKCISSPKSILLVCNHSALFWSELQKLPFNLGIKGGTNMSVKLRHSASYQERAPLEQMDKDNKQKNRPSKDKK